MKMAVRNIIRKELHQMRWIIIIGLLVGFGLAVILASTFGYLDQIVEEIPPELFELLSQYEVTRELLAIFGDYTLYVWSQWHAKNLYQIGALFAIIIAATQFAGEVSRRTIGYYLTRPVSRREGYLAKVASGLLVLLIIFAGGTLMIWAVSAVMGQTAEWGRFFGALFISLVWLAAYYLLGTIISILNREPVTAGIIIGLAGILLSLPGMFAVSRPFSIFYQMRAVDYFVYGQSLFPPLIYGLVLNVILLLIGLRVFAKKDF
jgi:ABC-type transport system involved in multi-copper enzyme maturation permease subunit